MTVSKSGMNRTSSPWKSGFAISQNQRNTQFNGRSEQKMVTKANENPLKCGSQNGKAKSPRARLIAQLARFVRKAGLSYDDWRYVARRVRQKCDLRPAAKPKKLPRVLTADQFRAFYKAVDAAEDVQHALMLRLLFYTCVRVSRTVRHRGRRRGFGELQDFHQPGQGVEGPVRSLRQVLRHRPSHPHRRPSPEPLAVPDQAVREVFRRGGWSKSLRSMPSRLASRRPRIRLRHQSHHVV